MNGRGLSLILAVAAVTGFTGCGVSTAGGGGRQINVAIASAPSAMFLNDYSTVSATTNDSAGVTWTCAPASSCGVFASSQTMNAAANTYTAPAQIPSGNLVTLTATSVSDTTKSASARVIINVSGIQVSWNTFPSSPLMVSGTESLEVQVQGDSANAGISLTCAPANACGSFSQSTVSAPQNGTYAVDFVYTAPANVPPGMVATLIATSNADNAQSIGTPVSITNSVSTVSTLSGTFAFVIRGIDANGAHGVAGSITLDGEGNVSAGEIDSADPSTVISTAILPTGSPDISGNPSVSGYTLGQSGHGILTLEFNYNGSAYKLIFSLTATSSSHALLAEVDETANLTGALDLQSGTFAASQFAGNYCFVSIGEDVARKIPMTRGGVFTADGSGNLSSGTLDVNDGGNYRSVPLSATFTAPDAYGRGTITFTSMPVSFAYYIVRPEVIRIIEIDATTGVTAGTMYGQGASSTATNAQFSGNYVFAIDGFGVRGSDATAGEFLADGSGNFAGILDNNEGGSASMADTFTGATYSFPGGARGSLSFSNGPFTANVYLTDPNINLLDPNNASGGGGGVMLETDASGTDIGVVVPQTSGSISGNYAMAWRYRPGTVTGYNNNYDVGLTAAVVAGSGSFNGEGEWDLFSTGPDQPINGTYTADSNHPGRYTGTFSPAPNAGLLMAYYQISNSQVVTVELDSAVSQGVLIKQTLP